ncbi:unnamed protein product, partial [Ectocarpus sp. 8 AP-2014]
DDDDSPEGPRPAVQHPGHFDWWGAASDPSGTFCRGPERRRLRRQQQQQGGHENPRAQVSLERDGGHDVIFTAGRGRERGGFRLGSVLLGTPRPSSAAGERWWWWRRGRWHGLHGQHQRRRKLDLTTEDPYVRASLKRAIVQLYDTCHRLLSFMTEAQLRRLCAADGTALPSCRGRGYSRRFSQAKTETALMTGVGGAAGDHLGEKAA